MLMFKIIVVLLLVFYLVNISFTDVKYDLNNRKQELSKLHTNLLNKKVTIYNYLLKEMQMIMHMLIR